MLRDNPLPGAASARAVEPSLHQDDHGRSREDALAGQARQAAARWPADAVCGPHGYKTWKELGVTVDEHGIGHTNPSDPSRDKNAVPIRKFHAARVADLAKRLAAIPEGNGTMLATRFKDWMTITQNLSCKHAFLNHGSGYGALGCFNARASQANGGVNDPLAQTVDHALAGSLPGIIPVVGVGVHMNPEASFANTVSVVALPRDDVVRWFGGRGLEELAFVAFPAGDAVLAGRETKEAAHSSLPALAAMRRRESG
ncbi:MAG: hypothetical protein NTV08_17520 [Verrucomicrobia bacterium]|nr:hypothetical protein [Verrucomicrobiota bacterium]